MTLTPNTEDEIKMIKIKANYSGIIEVKDYPYNGNIIYGTKEEDGWILEDGDIYLIEDLINEGYSVKATTGQDIFEDGKAQGIFEERERMLKLLSKMREQTENIWDNDERVVTIVFIDKLIELINSSEVKE